MSVYSGKTNIKRSFHLEYFGLLILLVSFWGIAFEFLTETNSSVFTMVSKFSSISVDSPLTTGVSWGKEELISELFLLFFTATISSF